jgi:hypothetical protein
MATTAVSNGMNHHSEAEAEADSLSSATACHEGDVYVCDKAIQTTRHPYPILRPESQTQAVSTMTSHHHSPQTYPRHGRLPETSPNSENAARALSSLFHHFPPAYHHHHHSPYSARPTPSPSWGRPPPPRFSYPPPSQHPQHPPPEYHSSWQRRQYPDAASTPYVARASSGSFEVSFGVFVTTHAYNQHNNINVLFFFRPSSFLANPYHPLVDDFLIYTPFTSRNSCSSSTASSSSCIDVLFSVSLQ